MNKILIVDDNEDLLDVYSFYLEDIEVEVLTAKNYDEAKKIILEEDPSLIISDYHMPGKNGSHVMKYNAENKNVPLFICTGGFVQDYPDLEQLTNLNKKNKFIQKPVVAEELEALVTETLRQEPTGRTEKEFIPVSLRLVERFGQVEDVEIFVQIGGAKAVLIKKRDVPMQPSIFERWKGRGISHFTLKREDFSIYAEKLRKVFLKDKVRESIHMSYSQTLDSCFDFLQSLGLSNKLDNQVYTEVSSQILECLDKFPPDFFEHVMSVFGSDQFNQNHSVLIALFLQISKSKLDPEDRSPVIHAAILHDLLHEGDELTCLNSPSDKFKQHPVELAHMLKNTGNFSNDVVEIVQHHHEEPDGSGFPNGLTEEALSTNDKLFLVLHKLSEKLLDAEKSDDSPHATLAEISNSYRQFPGVVEQATNILSALR